MMQMDIFRESPPVIPTIRPAARRTDPATSHAAAESMCQAVHGQRAAIVEALAFFGPAGKDLIAFRAGMNGVAAARRLPELERMGKVKRTGRTVKSNSGRDETEWAAA